MERNQRERIELRPTTKADRNFLLEVYEASRAFELQFVDWDDKTKRVFIEHQFDAQDAHYREHYADATFDVVLVDGCPAGRLYLYRGEKQIAIMDLTLLPEFRGRSIGGKLISRILEDARSSGRSVRVFLENFNPYKPVFIKFGFEIVEDDGVTQRYEWSQNS
jgi:GNAT superfamily N-acetyltransferase